MTWPPNWSRLWLVNAHTAFIRLLIQHFQFVSGVIFYKLNKFFKFQLLLCTLLIMCLFDSYWWRVLSDIICWRNNLFDSMHMLFWFWIFHYFIFYSSVKLFMGVHQKKMSFQKKLQFHSFKCSWMYSAKPKDFFKSPFVSLRSCHVFFVSLFDVEIFFFCIKHFGICLFLLLNLSKRNSHHLWQTCTLFLFFFT